MAHPPCNPPTAQRKAPSAHPTGHGTAHGNGTAGHGTNALAFGERVRQPQAPETPPEAPAAPARRLPPNFSVVLSGGLAGARFRAFARKRRARPKRRFPKGAPGKAPRARFGARLGAGRTPAHSARPRAGNGGGRCLWQRPPTSPEGRTAPLGSGAAHARRRVIVPSRLP